MARHGQSMASSPLANGSCRAQCSLARRAWSSFCPRSPRESRAVSQHPRPRLPFAFAARAASPSSEASSSEITQLPKAILAIAVPTTLSLAIEPLASLISTAFVGHLGTSQLAGVGVSLTLFNSFTKLFNMPLLAIITTFMASSTDHRSLNDALRSCAALAVIVGLVQTTVLFALMETSVGLSAYGLAAESAAYSPACAYLRVRVLGNMVSVVFFAMLGVFRGLQDTVSPLLATLVFTLSSVCLEYVLLFRLSLGPAGAALAVVAAQCMGVTLQMGLLVGKHGVSIGNVMFGGKDDGDDDKLSKQGLVKKLSMCGILMCRTSLVMLVYSSATSMIARSGDPVLSASHQIAFQLWLASSLLADSLAVAAQSLMAKSMSGPGSKISKTTWTSREIGWRCLQYAVVLGCALTAAMCVGLPRILSAFTTSPDVLNALSTISGYVVFSQVISSVAFVLDGMVYAYGEEGFRYATVSMLFSAAGAISSMWLASQMSLDPLTSSWIGLMAFMVGRGLTMSAFFLRQVN